MWPQVISGAVGNVMNAIINYIFGIWELVSLMNNNNNNAYVVTPSPLRPPTAVEHSLVVSILENPSLQIPIGLSVAASVHVGSVLATRLSSKVSLILAGRNSVLFGPFSCDFFTPSFSLSPLPGSDQSFFLGWVRSWFSVKH